MGDLPDLKTVIDATLQDHAHVTQRVGASPQSMFDFQWPWSIASAGANHLSNHGPAINALVSGGSQVASSPSGASITAAVASGPTNPTNTDRVVNDGIFSSALGSVQADQLLRTVLIGWSSGVQVGIVGGGGGSGVAYDIIDHSNRSGVQYSAFNLGIGGQVNAGLVLGAMTAEPASLNESTCVWSVGASVIAVGVFVQV
ncbi:MAG: hypothetical protein HGB05_09465, partial [Chloroflexi bacterium]|nr:hypothetical protein [Chloroflexota bacterium]